MKAKLRNTEIYFDIAGMQLAPVKNDFVEKPVLFMLHGGPGGDHLRFKQHSLELQDSAQLIFIDHRGCGRSKKTKAKDYTLENNIEDIEALRNHLGLSTISILGASYGGVVAQGYAIRYPKNVDKLILSVTAPSFRFIEEAKKILKQRGTPKQIAAAEKLWNGSFKSSKEVADFFTLLDSIYSNKSKKKTNLGKSHTTWSYEAINNGFGDFLRKYDYIPQLKKISADTLILAGADDWICPPSQSKVIASHIPNATLKIFKDAGHALAIDQHKAYIKIVQKFLKVEKKVKIKKKK
ncbi:MAG TPA: alpha/beta hydrolase [Gammaproteobacteria bacterium]|jgi:proline iminopeptidase|nr:alpha/beta hydrolase [Gammaproteobacteria bacterium]